MTQPVPIETAVLSYKDLLAKCREESGLDEQEFDELRRTVRLPGWDVEGPCPPFAASHRIFAMFAGSAGDRTGDFTPGDVRAFVRPSVYADKDGNAHPWLCFTLNRAASSPARTDVLPMRLWIETVGYEFAASIVEGDDEEEEDQEIECKAIVKASAEAAPAPCAAVLDVDAKFCHRCGAAVRAACAECGRRPEIDDRFCAGCGLPVGSPPKPQPVVG